MIRRQLILCVAASMLMAGMVSLVSTPVRASNVAPQIEDLTTAKAFHVTGVSATISPDGELLATNVCDPGRFSIQAHEIGTPLINDAEYRSRGCDIWLVALKSGRTRNLTAAVGGNWAPSWSPDGRMLAFHSNRDGQAKLWIWERESDTFRKVSDAITRQWFAFDVPIWLPDARTVLVMLHPEEPLDETSKAHVESAKVDVDKEPGSTVNVFVSPRPALESQRSTQSDSNPYVLDVGLMDAVTGAVERRARHLPIRFHRLSPDGRQLACLNERSGAGGDTYELVLIDLSSGVQRQLAPTVVQTAVGAFSWSPDGRYVAYASVDVEKRRAQVEASRASSLRPTTGDLYVTAVDGATRRVSGAPDNHFRLGVRPPLWDGEARYLYVVGSDAEIWKIDVAAGQGRPLTQNTAVRKQIIVGDPAENRVASADDTRFLYVSTRDAKTHRDGFAMIDVASGRVTQLLEEDKAYGNFSGRPVMSPDHRSLVFAAESSDRDEDLWRLDLSSRRSEKLTSINPGLERYTFGKSRLVEFRSHDGNPLQASLLLPADHRSGQRYPLVLWVYASNAEAAAESLNRFGLTGVDAFNMHMLTTRGYAVMWPDIPTRKGTPMQDLMKAVMPAIDKVVELGIADPDRLAVMGNSNGGYSTLALIAQTTRFKAAVMNAGIGDLTSYHGAWHGAGIPWLENRGGSMGAPPWEVPLRYVMNSPIYFLDRIETPLIIQAGTADFGIIEQSDQVWTGMKRLNKQVTYLRYDGESHVLEAAANQKDYWKRVLEFFDEHLNTRQP